MKISEENYYSSKFLGHEILVLKAEKGIPGRSIITGQMYGLVTYAEKHSNLKKGMILQPCDFSSYEKLSSHYVNEKYPIPQ